MHDQRRRARRTSDPATHQQQNDQDDQNHDKDATTDVDAVSKQGGQ